MGNAQPAPGAAPAARPADPPPTTVGPASVAGMRVLEPHEVKGQLTDFYDMPEGAKQLGRGHYGSVTTCISKATGRKCAVKSVAKLKPRHIQMLKNEVAIMRSLDHPSIITLFDVFEDESHVQLVMELCTGGELFDQIIAEQHFTEAKAARVMRTMLTAVDYCHRNNVVHRDLKPENMLLVSKEADAELKVIDFGLSKRFNMGEEMHARVGTPYYIAPEVLEKRYGKECDLWSCGVVMYILLCGYPPFWGDRDQEIFRKVKLGQVSFEGPEWETVSDRAKHLILCLLTNDRHQRITAADALKHRWLSIGGLQEKVISSHMFERLQRFTLYSKLKQIAIILISARLQESDVRNSKAVFEKLDIGPTGSIGLAHLHGALTQCKYINKDEESCTQLIIDALDVRGLGYIGLTEFVAGTIKDTLYLDASRVYDVHEELSSCGYITCESVERVLEEKFHIRDPEYRRHLAEVTVKQVDPDIDPEPQPGKIVFDHFFRAMCAGERPT